MAEDLAPPQRSSFPVGARCAHHPDRLAERVCTRCGNYMCRECNTGNANGLCLGCVARIGAQPGFPFTRDNFTFDGLLNYALSRWKPRWLMLSFLYAGLMTLAYAVALVCGAALGGLPNFDAIARGEAGLSDAGWQVQLAMNGVLVICELAAALVASGVWLDVLEGVESNLQRALLRLRALPAQLLVIVIIYFALALLAAPGFAVFELTGGEAGLPLSLLATLGYAVLLLPVLSYAGVGVAFVTFELAHNPEATALSALRLSWRIARSRRWLTVGVLSMAGLIMGLGVLACCVGAFVSTPLALMLWGALFLSLKQETPPHSAAITQEWPV